MPGRPLLRAFSEQIESEGGDDVILSRIADGDSVGKIMGDYNLSRNMFYDWVHQSSEREKMWSRARRLGAEANVEQGQKLLDDLGSKVLLSNAEVSLANSRANWRKWLASKRDPDTYGDDKTAAVALNLNVGELHLQALIGGGLAEPSLEVAGEVIDAEVLAIEEESGVVPAEDEFEADPILVDLL